MSLRDDHAGNKRMIESTAGESDYDNFVNNNVWLMDGGWCAEGGGGVLPLSPTLDFTVNSNLIQGNVLILAPV